MPPPGFDQHLCVGEAVEDIAIEKLVAKRPVEALVVAVLPWLRRGDVERRHADPSQPFVDCRGDKFAAVAHWEAPVWEPPRL